MGRVEESYKTFVIKATALPLRKPEGGFTVHTDIRKDHGGFSDEPHFESGQIFPSENEALRAGLQIGKQQVDAGFQPKNIVTNIDELVGSQD